MNGTDVLAVVQQMCGKAVPVSVTTGGFADTGALDGDFDSFLEVFSENDYKRIYAAAEKQSKMLSGLRRSLSEASQPQLSIRDPLRF